MAPVISLIIWFGIYVAIVVATGALYRTFAREELVRVLFLPGYLAVWAGRVVACTVTGAGPNSKHVYDKSGEGKAAEGEAPSEATRAAVAMMGFGVSTALLVALFVVPRELPVPVHANPPDTIQLTPDGIFLSIVLAGSYSLEVWRAIFTDPLRWQLWAALYASAALIVAGAPEKRDLGWVVAGVGGPVLAAIGLDHLGVGAGVSAQARLAVWLAGDSVWRALGFALAMATFTLCVSAAVLLGLGLWRRRAARGRSVTA